MDQDATVSHTPPPMTQRERLALLLEMTGELEKAELLHDHLPDWLINASGEWVEKLDKAAYEAFSLQITVQVRLSDLKPLDGFCREHLETALNSRFGEGLEVDKDHLWMPQVEFFSLGRRFIETFLRLRAGSASAYWKPRCRTLPKRRSSLGSMACRPRPGWRPRPR